MTVDPTQPLSNPASNDESGLTAQQQEALTRAKANGLMRSDSESIPISRKIAMQFGYPEEGIVSTANEERTEWMNGRNRTSPFSPTPSSLNLYPDYDLSTKDGMRQFLDDVSWKMSIKNNISVAELGTAKTLLSSYFGVNNSSLKNGMSKWDSLTMSQVNDRLEAVQNKYAAYNMIPEEHYVATAKDLGFDAASIKAVAEVESKGLAFVKEDMPVVLFERHRFSANTGGIYDKNYPGLSSESPGGYGRTGTHQYEPLNAAIGLNRSAALMSASWGRFQIMGENYGQAGFSNVEDFVSASKEGAARQLDIFATFIKNDTRLLDALRAQKWERFARIYNGPNYRINAYDTKLDTAHKSFSN